MGKSKSKQILEEVGNGMSESSREAIMSIDILEKRVAELEGLLEKALGEQEDEPNE